MKGACTTFQDAELHLCRQLIIGEWGGAHKYMACSTQLISFEIDCFLRSVYSNL